MSTHDKNTGKTKPAEHKGSTSKNHNTNINMVKEASPNEINQNYKAPKNNKGKTSSSDISQTLTSTPTSTSAKNNSSERSPLEGNPQKKQCETASVCSIADNTQQTPTIELSQTEEQTESRVNTQDRGTKKNEKEEQENIHLTENMNLTKNH